jgi:hypothetical protein
VDAVVVLFEERQRPFMDVDALEFKPLLELRLLREDVVLLDRFAGSPLQLLELLLGEQRRARWGLSLCQGTRKTGCTWPGSPWALPQ